MVLRLNTGDRRRRRGTVPAGGNTTQPHVTAGRSRLAPAPFLPASPGSPAAAGANPNAKFPQDLPSAAMPSFITPAPWAATHQLRQAAPPSTWTATVPLPASSRVGCKGGSGSYSSPHLLPSSAGHSGSLSCSSWTDTARRPVPRGAASRGVSWLSGKAAGSCHLGGGLQHPDLLAAPHQHPALVAWVPAALHSQEAPGTRQQLDGGPRRQFAHPYLQCQAVWTGWAGGCRHPAPRRG